MKNNFKQVLDGHLETVFYNTKQFGVEDNYLLYYPGGGVDSIPLPGIFDRKPTNNPIEDSNSEFIDNRPQLRVREVDFEAHSIANNKYPDVKTDRFVIYGDTFEIDDYDRTDTGEVICYLMEIR